MARGGQARAQYGPRPDAARILQHGWRAGAGVKRARLRRAAEMRASVVLQSLARGGVLRRRLARRLAAARFADSDSELEDVDDLLDDGWMAAAAAELDGYAPRASQSSASRGSTLAPLASLAVPSYADDLDPEVDDDDDIVVPYRIALPAAAAATSPMRAPLRPAAAASYAATRNPPPARSAAGSAIDTGGGCGSRAPAALGYAASEGGASAHEAREAKKADAREALMLEWGLTDSRTAELLMRRKGRLGAQKKKAEQRARLQDPMRRLEHAQQLSRAWHAPEDAASRYNHVSMVRGR